MFYDALNRRINCGDIVTYPVRRRSALYMRVGKVVGIELDGERGVSIVVQGRTVKVTEAQRLTIAVRGADIREAVTL